MDVTLLWAQAAPIPAHAVMALCALVLGIWQLTQAKGTTTHRILGWLWVALMAGTASTALFIHDIRLVGPFSPIHLLVPVVFYSLWVGLRAIRRGDIDAHRRAMRNLFYQALILAGVFTLLPGRVMYRMLFGA